MRFTESGDAFHVRQEAQHFDRAVIRLDLLYCLCALNAKHHFMKIVVFFDAFREANKDLSLIHISLTQGEGEDAKTITPKTAKDDTGKIVY